jgi:hypothetical protein
VPEVVVRAHVDRAMRRQLCGVDQDLAADRVHLLGEPVDRLDDPGDVGRPRHRQQGDTAGADGQQPIERVLVQCAVGCGRDADGPPPCPPGQVVRVVLQHRREHHGARRHPHRARQTVQCLGRVLAEQDHVTVGVGADEGGDVLARPPC